MTWRRYYQNIVNTEEYAQAERYALAALTVFDELENVGRWLAWSHMLLGQVARSRGEGDTAEAHLREAVKRWRMLKRTAPLARTLNDLGNALWPAGKTAEAEACFVEATALLAPTAYELDKTLTQLSLGTFYYHQQQWDKAEAAFRRADSPYLRQSGHVVYQGYVANNLGNVLLKRGRPLEAEYYLRRALHLWRRFEIREIVIGNYCLLPTTHCLLLTAHCPLFTVY
ncbi:MAG TPA: tetratricopeptide repeat protein [Anaerolineae bacterium]